jgi:hypothetical protein
MHIWRGVAAITLCALGLTACGGSGAGPLPGPTAATTAVPTGTVTPAILVAYARQVTPTLKTTVSQLDSIIHEIKSTSDMESLAADCAQAGAVLSTDSNAFQTIATPKQARSYFSDAVNGYGTSLVGFNDCSTAADARSKANLRSAGSELASAAANLTRARNGISSWSAHS